MAVLIDNITLALNSLKFNLKNYLRNNEWERVNIFLAKDPLLQNKQIVKEWVNSQNKVSLPLVVIDDTFVNTEDYEIGNIYGNDIVTLTIIISALDDNQLRTLSNMIRRYIKDLTFTIYDLRSGNEKSVGNGLITNPSLTDLSDLNSDDIFEQHNSIINSTLEISSESFI